MNTEQTSENIFTYVRYSLKGIGQQFFRFFTKVLSSQISVNGTE